MPGNKKAIMDRAQKPAMGKVGVTKKGKGGMKKAAAAKKPGYGRG